MKKDVSTKKAVEKWLCIFDVDNEQSDYAKCLQTIRWLENVEHASAEGSLNSVVAIIEPLAFDITRNPSETALNLKQLLAIEHRSNKRHITDCNRILEVLKTLSSPSRFNYYIRVHMSSSDDVTDLQYLLLLLQANRTIKHKFTVRFMQKDQDSWDSNNYYRVSHFLQFVQNGGSQFYAGTDTQVDSIRKLASHPTGVQTTFLPILEINEDLCRELRIRHTICEHLEPNDKISFSSLYKKVTFAEEYANEFAKAVLQIGLRMLFGNLNGTKYKTTNKKGKLLSALCAAVKETGGITLLDILLLGALSDGDFYPEEDVIFTANLLREIGLFSEAIYQLIENAYHHSELHTGVFCFRIHSVDNYSYISLHYPDYAIAPQKRYVELLISDKNEKDCIIDNFVNSSKADKKLIAVKEKICLANFFGKYNNDEIMRTIWQDLRRHNHSFCHGLSTFAHTGYKLESAIRVRSSQSFSETSTRSFYYYVPGKTESPSIDIDADTLWIPGTQYSFLVQTGKLTAIAHERISPVFDMAQAAYTATYKDLAKCLPLGKPYCISDEKIRKQIKSILIETQVLGFQAKKDQTVNLWKDWFNQQFQTCTYPDSPESIVVEFDCSCLQDNCFITQAEPFSKGFFASDFIKPNNAIKRYILLTNISTGFATVLYSTIQAISSRLTFENICIYFYSSQTENLIQPLTTTNIYTLLKVMGYSVEDEELFPKIFPKDLFLCDEHGNKLFEREMLERANHSITDGNHQGFKVENSHMRLGNKVHIDTFYEMTLFFENPNYAYYTAFLFLKRLIDCEKFCKASKILFYGYSSYSRGLLWALVQIAKAYFNDDVKEIEYIIYQNDLQLESDQLSTQMYYSVKSWQDRHPSIWEPQDTFFVQIVPISSSLTTFQKMHSKLLEDTGKNFSPEENYTAFWVRDDYVAKHTDLKESLAFEKPTAEEKIFWESANQIDKTINCKDIKEKFSYLVFVTSFWRNPLNCKKCFPSDPLGEFPLVETDPTSTIPTLQLYLNETDRSVSTIGISENIEHDDTENDRRIAELKNHLLYGHISRGRNHYQYYVRTKQFFQHEREKIKAWLSELRYLAKNEDPDAFKKSINVLVIPKQSSNVEFGQFVYEYFFHGEAESIIVNTEKEFRSNFRAEYHALFLRLKTQMQNKYQIRFHYVDTAISSGTTFSRAATLITTCFNEINGTPANAVFKTHPFANVFLLISRLSKYSKYDYVLNPQTDFHAYAELHISSIRTFGDSCVPCKLQQESVKYYRYAATKLISGYWEGKSIDRKCKHFDKVKSELLEDAIDTNDGYYRMICTHRANHFIQQIRGQDVADYFDRICDFLDELCEAYALCMRDSTSQIPIYSKMVRDEWQNWLSAALKVLARPFFSFDYKMRCAVMDLFILLSEYLIGDNAKLSNSIDALTNRVKDLGEIKDYLLSKNRLGKVRNLASEIEQMAASSGTEQELITKMNFVRQNILKSLADLKSNYVIRKSTILAIFNALSAIATQAEDGNNAVIRSFYESYIRSILRVVQSSSDETRSVWLECLLQNGHEYGDEVETKDSLAVPENVKTHYMRFREILLIENNRSLYQSMPEIKKIIDSCKSEVSEEQHSEVLKNNIIKAIGRYLESNHMKNVVEYLNYSQNYYEMDNEDKKEEIDNEDEKKYGYSLMRLGEIYNLLLQTGKTDDTISKKYDSLRKAIKNAIFDDCEQSAEVIMFERWSDNVSNIKALRGFPPYCVISPAESSLPYLRNKPLMKALELLQEHEATWTDALETDGYWLFPVSEKDNSDYCHVLFALDNNYDKLDKYQRQENHVSKISQVLIYVSHAFSRDDAIRFLRTILMFRFQLVKWLEGDFGNNTIISLSQHRHLAELLSNDKVGDHQDEDFIEAQQYLLTLGSSENCLPKGSDYEEMPSQAGENYYEADYINEAYAWFLLCSYVNSRISRLYRTFIRAEGLGTNTEELKAYYDISFQKFWMEPEANLGEMFDKTLTYGNSRRRYLELLLSQVSFQCEDSEIVPNSSIDMRVQYFIEALRKYELVSFPEKDPKYAYLSEYLVAIFLDCCMSAIRASSVRNLKFANRYDEFCYLKKSDLDKKCKIIIAREKTDKGFDYLVLRNESVSQKVEEDSGNLYKGPGMSQAAIRWYIEKLWQLTGRNCQDTKVQFIPPDRSDTSQDKFYCIKLPILKPTTSEVNDENHNYN